VSRRVSAWTVALSAWLMACTSGPGPGFTEPDSNDADVDASDDHTADSATDANPCLDMCTAQAHACISSCGNIAGVSYMMCAVACANAYDTCAASC